MIRLFLNKRDTYKRLSQYSASNCFIVSSNSFLDLKRTTFDKYPCKRLSSSFTSFSFIYPISLNSMDGECAVLFEYVCIEIKCFIVLDRKSTRLNSSHVAISYAVFCLK